MNRTTTVRVLPSALVAAVAAASAAAALAATAATAATAHGGIPHASQQGSVSAKEVALRSGMRQLWEDHVMWTRLAVLSLTTGAPDTDATVGRLLENQTDIGNAVKPFYGKAAGARLTAKLRTHILVAADVIAAARAGDETKLAAAQARWQRNADEIAALLASVNPRHWKLSTMKRELQIHLALTTGEVVARLQGNWGADVAAYDRIHRHALHLADLLSTGLVKQFPGRFR